MNFLLKNKALGKWDDRENRYTEFYGNSLISDSTSTLNELVQDINTPIEELEVTTKMTNIFSHVISKRIEKEFTKHKNYMNDVMIGLKEFSKNTSPYKISNQEYDTVLQVIQESKKNVHSKTGMGYIKRSEDTLKKLISGKSNVESEIKGMDLIGSIALYKTIKRNSTSGVRYTKDELLKESLKDAKKLVSRGDFDEFYKSDSVKAVFDELSGVRNTGNTHRYATQIRTAASELSKLKPMEILEKIGPSVTRNMSLDELNNIKKYQKYYSENLDLFIDNMIESAISAKHGLTLGGLEGSKLFVNSLLGVNSDDMNDYIINLYEKAVIKNNDKAIVNLMENIAYYKQAFNERDDLLQNILKEVDDAGLNEKILFKYMDLGKKSFKETFKGYYSQDTINKYIKFAEKYMNESYNIEKDMMMYLAEKQYVDPKEFEIYKGLNLFGELLIQNEPGLEYEAKDALEAINKFNLSKKTAKDYDELFSNKEIINLKAQAFTSLGSAASISNISKMRKYISAFAENYTIQTANKNFHEAVTNLQEIRTLIDNGVDVFDKNNEIKQEVLEQLSENTADSVIKYTELKNKEIKKSGYVFFNRLIGSSTDPVSAYSYYLNANNTLFSKGGKSGEESIEMFKQFKKYGIPSLNQSSLSESIQNIDLERNEFLKTFIENYKMYDNNFSSFSLEELIKQSTNYETGEFDLSNNIVTQLNKSIENALFNINKNSDEIKLANPYSMVRFVISDKLSKREETLKSAGKIFQINPARFEVKRLKEILEKSGRKFFIDDSSIFYDKGVFNKKRFNDIYDLSRDHKLYFSESIARMYFPKDINKFISKEERNRLGGELLAAKRFLDEDFTEENVLKRLNGDLDLNLIANIYANDMFKYSSTNYSDAYKKSFSKNLRAILEDFKSVDKDITSTYINPNYLKLAQTYTDINKTYKQTIGLNSSNLGRYNKTRTKLNRIINDEKQWFVDNDIDTDLFTKMASSEILNQNAHSNQEIKDILMNVAKVMKGSEVENIDVKYNTIADNIANTVGTTKGKFGLAALISSGALFVGNKIRPFFGKTGGVYTLSNNANGMSEKEILEKLNIANGMKSDITTEELKGNFGKKTHVSVKDNNF